MIYDDWNPGPSFEQAHTSKSSQCWVKLDTFQNCYNCIPESASLVFVSWKWGHLLCTRPTGRVGFVYSASSLKQQVDMSFTWTHHYYSEPTSPWSYSLILHAYQRNNKYQFYSLWFDLTGTHPMIYHTWGKHNNHYTIDAVGIITWWFSWTFSCQPKHKIKWPLFNIIFSIKGKYGSGTTVKQWEDPTTGVLYNGFPYVVWRDGWNNPKCLCQEPNS